MTENTGARRRALAEALAAGAGLGVFALLRHRGGVLLALGVAALAVSAVALGFGVAAERSVARAFGLVPGRPHRRCAAVVSLGIALGVAGAIRYRMVYNWEPWPPSLRAFAVLAALIGSTEELVFRGVLYTRLRPGGFWPATTLPAALHALYKGALFAWPQGPAGPHVLAMSVGTFVAGFALGALRELSGDAWGSIGAHAVFDLVVYAEQVSAPWWIWS